MALRDEDRWVAVARPRGEVLGAISLLDAGEPTTNVGVFELEQAATVWVGNSSTAEAWRRPRWHFGVDFATELLEDADVDRLRSHADRLGYDLDQPHRAVFLLSAVAAALNLREVVTRATTRLGLKGLATTRRDGVVLIVAEDLQWTDLAKTLDPEGEQKARMGVGEVPLGGGEAVPVRRRVRPHPHEIGNRQAGGDL